MDVVREMYQDLYGDERKGERGLFQDVRELRRTNERLHTAAKWLLVGLGLNLLTSLPELLKALGL